MKEIEELFLQTYKRFNVVFKSGAGMYLEDTEGKKYLDFVSGIAVNTFGYADKEISNVIKEQSEKLLHCSNLYFNDKQIELASLLASLSPLKKAFFCNSGTEALEAAIKFARFYGKDKKSEDAFQIITFNDSFHGRTFGALSATGQAKFHEPIKPMLPGFLHAKFNNIESVKEVYNKNVTAIILEPIQGEGGIIPADLNFLKELREFCDSNEVLLICDEVQCGTGRTGKFFAFQNFDIVPDMVCLAKGFGAGFPIGAVLANEKVAKCITYSSHGSTFGGNPLATAVAHNVTRRVSDESFLSNVIELGEYLKIKLMDLKEDFSIISQVRGMGLMQGIIFSEQRDDVVKACFQKQLLLVGAGKDCIRFVPPLICKKEDIDNCMGIIREVLSS